MRIQEERYNLNGHELLLRSAEETDAEMLLQYRKTTCMETRFLVKEPEENTLTLEQEKTYIFKQNSSAHYLLILGLLDGEHVGNCSLSRKTALRYRHRADIGIALYQKYTGMGIGKIMLERLFCIAGQEGIEQLELEVVADNQRAVALYRKMGFEIFGQFPDNMKYKDGTYADAYWMMKRL